MAKIKLTAKKLEALKPGAVRAEYFDIDLPGLCLRITPDGTKSFSVFYRHAGRVRRYTLGTYPTVTLKDAREGTLDVLRDVLRGNDPQHQKTAERREPSRNLQSCTWKNIRRRPRSPGATISECSTNIFFQNSST